MSRKSTTSQSMSKHVGKMLLIGSNPIILGLFYTKKTLRIHFWCIPEAKSMVLWRCLAIFDKHVKNQFRLDGLTRNFMIRSTVTVKNCIDIIFEGLRDIWISVLLLFFHYIRLGESPRREGWGFRVRRDRSSYPAVCILVKLEWRHIKRVWKNVFFENLCERPIEKYES